MRHFGISIVVAYAFALAACGQNNHGDGGETPPTRPGPEAAGPIGPSGPGAADSPLDQSAAPAQGQGGGNPAYYLATLDELPSCDDEHRRWLAYVAEASAFYHCAADGWQVVDLKGKDGSAGKDGRDGTEVDNTWRDPVTGRTWLVGGAVRRAFAVCPAGWTFPTQAIGQEAYLNGLGVALEALASSSSFWLPDDPNDPVAGRHPYLNPASSAFVGSTTDATMRVTLACYRD